MSDYEYYVLTEEVPQNKAKIVGYFSRYKDLGVNNLSCIVVFPAYQKKGYGKFLIELSYYFSRQEKRISTPELPLSESGRILYLSYWKQTIFKLLSQTYSPKSFSELKKILAGSLNPVRDLSKETFITEIDVATTLKHLGLLKYYKG